MEQFGRFIKNMDESVKAIQERGQGHCEKCQGCKFSIFLTKLCQVRGSMAAIQGAGFVIIQEVLISSNPLPVFRWIILCSEFMNTTPPGQPPNTIHSLNKVIFFFFLFDSTKKFQMFGDV